MDIHYRYVCKTSMSACVASPLEQISVFKLPAKLAVMWHFDYGKVTKWVDVKSWGIWK